MSCGANQHRSSFCETAHGAPARAFEQFSVRSVGESNKVRSEEVTRCPLQPGPIHRYTLRMCPSGRRRARVDVVRCACIALVAALACRAGAIVEVSCVPGGYELVP